MNIKKCKKFNFKMLNILLFITIFKCSQYEKSVQGKDENGCIKEAMEENSLLCLTTPNARTEDCIILMLTSVDSCKDVHWVTARMINEQSKLFIPERIMGMNRYMYVEGNPVKYRDDSWHSATVPSITSSIDYFAKGVSAISSGIQSAMSRSAGMYNKYVNGENSTKDTIYQRMAKDIKGGVHWAGEGIRIRDIANGIEWGSKNIRNSGLNQAADTFNKATGQDYERKLRGKCQIGISYNPICELGLRGYRDKLSKYTEIGGLGANGLAVFGLGDDIIQLATSPEFALMTAGLDLPFEYGDSFYRKNERHRARVKVAACMYLANKSTIDRDTLGFVDFWCHENFQYKE